MLPTTSTLESHSTGALGSIVPFVHSFFLIVFSVPTLCVALTKLRAPSGERPAMILTVTCVREARIRVCLCEGRKGHFHYETHWMDSLSLYEALDDATSERTASLHSSGSDALLQSCFCFCFVFSAKIAACEVQ